MPLCCQRPHTSPGMEVKPLCVPLPFSLFPTQRHPVPIYSHLLPRLVSLSGFWTVLRRERSCVRVCFEVLEGFKLRKGRSRDLFWEKRGLCRGRKSRMDGSGQRVAVGSGQRVAVESDGFGIGPCVRASKRVAFAVLTCAFAVGGAIVGTITGALKGQTTETGLLRGAGIGAVTGALVSVELLESLLHGELLSKIAMFESLLNGKIFREWVSPATLKAYQWQVSTLENAERESSDIFDTSSNQGVSPDIVRMLPRFEVRTFSAEPSIEASCAVCLQDFKDDESVRGLPICRHLYHMACIDRWLIRHNSCPICRRDL